MSLISCPRIYMVRITACVSRQVNPPLGSQFCESDAQPTLNRQRAVKECGVALLQAKTADFHREGTLQLIEKWYFL